MTPLSRMSTRTPLPGPRRASRPRRSAREIAVPLEDRPEPVDRSVPARRQRNSAIRSPRMSRNERMSLETRQWCSVRGRRGGPHGRRVVRDRAGLACATRRRRARGSRRSSCERCEPRILRTRGARFETLTIRSSCATRTPPRPAPRGPSQHARGSAHTRRDGGSAEGRSGGHRRGPFGGLSRSLAPRYARSRALRLLDLRLDDFLATRAELPIGCCHRASSTR